jgi:hypothetical protein
VTAPGVTIDALLLPSFPITLLFHWIDISKTWP